MRASLLIYDIPDAAGLKNPSSRLRRLAVRINLSCWVIQTGDIPYNYLNTLRAGGATWHTVPFDQLAGAQLVAMASDAVKKEIREGMERAREGAANAIAALDNADDPLEAEVRFARQTRQISRRASNLIRDMREVAGRFGVDIERMASTATNAVIALKAGMVERARLYAAAIAQVRELYGIDDPMAAAMEADQVPALIAADYIEDRGGTATALRGAFDGE